MILLDSGQITCESFKSSGLDIEELVAVVDVFLSIAELLETFVCILEIDEDEEDLIVDGFAGTGNRKNLIESHEFQKQNFFVFT